MPRGGASRPASDHGVDRGNKIRGVASLTYPGGGDMTRVTRRDFNRLAAGSAVAGPAAMAMPSFVRAQGSKLKVGVLLPRSGALAFIGQSCQRGADIAPAMLREMYGVDIELMNADIESNVDVARSRAEKLIDEGAQVLVGAFD